MTADPQALPTKCPSCGWYLWGRLRIVRGVVKWHCWVCGRWQRWERKK
jgi:predicted RNA-binding Zn-ribbon protein involved in translation (DUF1610 family)